MLRAFELLSLAPGARVPSVPAETSRAEPSSRGRASSNRTHGRWRVSLWATLALLLIAALAPGASQAQRRFPNIVVLSVDTLRWDRLSTHGYSRPTSPHMDALGKRGAVFERARTPEPLTAPAMISIFTGLHPHDHGATRNGLAMRPNLPSWTRILAGKGYKTSAFVGNWTLRPGLSGLEEHFDEYEAILDRKRWGLFLGEATADDLNESALAWLDDHLEADDGWPFLLWVHYVEPHAPYRFHKEVASRLGIRDRDDASDRYDTEVARVDRSIGDFLVELQMKVDREDLLIVLLSDHGESLGEHDYWGHGRHLYDATLHIPLMMTWEGRISQQRVQPLASSLDIGPTLFGLLGLESPQAFAGFDWSDHLAGGPAPTGRITYHQAHKGAVQRRGNKNARRQGLLEVGLVEGSSKELIRVKNDAVHRLFDLAADPGELVSAAPEGAVPSDTLEAWLERVREGLVLSDELPPPALDAESIEQLRALGYID